MLLSLTSLDIFPWGGSVTQSTSRTVVTALYSALNVRWMGLTASKRVYAFPGYLKVLYRASETLRQRGRRKLEQHYRGGVKKAVVPPPASLSFVLLLFSSIFSMSLQNMGSSNSVKAQLNYPFHKPVSSVF